MNRGGSRVLDWDLWMGPITFGVGSEENGLRDVQWRMYSGVVDHVLAEHERGFCTHRRLLSVSVILRTNSVAQAACLQENAKAGLNTCRKRPRSPTHRRGRRRGCDRLASPLEGFLRPLDTIPQA